MWRGTRPFVHQGFLKSWTSNGLNTTIVARMKAAVDTMQEGGRKVKLYVTGARGVCRQARDPTLSLEAFLL